MATADELRERAAQPDIQELVASWGPPTAEQLALTARIFGGRSRPRQPVQQQGAA
jgi:hypothetical protein